jgi:hypothetical protein
MAALPKTAVIGRKHLYPRRRAAPTGHLARRCRMLVLACEASALPLSYAPSNIDSTG